MSNISTYVEHIVQNLIVKTEQMDPSTSGAWRGMDMHVNSFP